MNVCPGVKLNRDCDDQKPAPSDDGLKRSRVVSSPRVEGTNSHCTLVARLPLDVVRHACGFLSHRDFCATLTTSKEWKANLGGELACRFEEHKRSPTEIAKRCIVKFDPDGLYADDFALEETASKQDLATFPHQWTVDRWDGRILQACRNERPISLATLAWTRGLASLPYHWARSVWFETQHVAVAHHIGLHCYEFPPGVTPHYAETRVEMIEPTYKFYGKTTFPLRQEVQDLLQHGPIQVGPEEITGWKIDISQTDGICAELNPAFTAWFWPNEGLVGEHGPILVFARHDPLQLELYHIHEGPHNWLKDGMQSYAKTFNAISSGDERWVCTVLEDTDDFFVFERVQETD